MKRIELENHLKKINMTMEKLENLLKENGTSLEAVEKEAELRDCSISICIYQHLLWDEIARSYNSGDFAEDLDALEQA